MQEVRPSQEAPALPVEPVVAEIQQPALIPQPAPVRPPVEAVEAVMTVPTPGEQVVTLGPGHSCKGHGFARDPTNCRVYYR